MGIDLLISNEPERRAAPRVKTFEPAVLCGPDGELLRTHLLNISTTGALGYGQEAPKTGAIVTLHGALEFGQARIAWRKDNCFGLAFVKPLSSDQLARIVEAQRALVESSARRSGRVQRTQRR